MSKHIKNTIRIFFFLVTLFTFSQKVDSVYISTENTKAKNLEREGNYLKAYELINSLILKLDDSTPEFLILSYKTRASIENNLGKYKESINTSQNTLQICLKLKDSLNMAFSYNLIGIGYYFLSEYDSTKVYYEKSFALKKKINTDLYDLAVSAYNLAILYEDLAQTEKALKLYLEAEQNLLRSKFKKKFLSDIYVGIAHLYFNRKEITKAEEYSEKAIDFGLQSYGEFNPSMTFAYNAYANILISKKKYKEA
ncbi:MAG: tetratricopeptide repeat protein, partial [Flavobacteriaceae bacterium]|nr:tetratricopeptide repeat protein [Flavobacteriaceae bacterium]